MIKRFLTGRWYVVIAPPSLYLTRFMTRKQANFFASQFNSSAAGTSIVVRDISGRFTKHYLTKTYPITNPFDL